MSQKSHTSYFLSLAEKICSELNYETIESLAADLAHIRDAGGRLFILGVGGSAANCAHAVNDFRKLCGIESYAPTDNVSELTARTNDEGWETIFIEWLRVSRAKLGDALLILSVGGGSAEHKVSVNLIKAIDWAKSQGVKVFGIVGRDGGYTSKNGDRVVIVPTVDTNLVTPLAEGFQAIIWHALVSHPLLQVQATKW